MTDIFALGHLKIGNFILWITEPGFSFLNETQYSLDKHLNLDYYSCSLTEIKTYQDKSGKDFTCHYYINLVDKLKQHDNYFNFARPDKNINDEKELNHWKSCNDFQMPLSYLKRETIQKIINLLMKLSAKEQA